MSNAITMGIIWHLVGAASAACFYAPFKKVQHWSWETMWAIGGFVSWIILPWLVSYILLPDFWAYYGSFNASTLLPVFLLTLVLVWVAAFFVFALAVKPQACQQCQHAPCTQQDQRVVAHQIHQP